MVNQETRKFIGDIPEADMKLIEEACILERRSRISLIRKASIEYSKKILEEARNESRN